MATPKGLSSVSIVSGEPRPAIPPGLSPEMDNYARRVDDYLRRLAAKFSPSNIVNIINQSNVQINNTIVQGSGLTFVESYSFAYKYTGTDRVVKTLNTNDWRRRPFLYWVADADAVFGVDSLSTGNTSSTTTNFALDSYVGHAFAAGSTYKFVDFGGAYPPMQLWINNTADGFSAGQLSMVLNGSGIHQSFYTFLFIAVLAIVPNTAPGFSAAGNGL